MLPAVSAFQQERRLGSYSCAITAVGDKLRTLCYRRCPPGPCLHGCRIQSDGAFRDTTPARRAARNYKGTTMLRLPNRLAFSGFMVTVLLALSASLVWAGSPTVSFDTTIGPPPASTSFDISFVKNDIATYILADRKNNAVDLFNAKSLTFLGGIGSGGFVGSGPAVCAVPHACAGPNGDLIDNNNHVWVGDGPASDCSTGACRCFAGETTSMVKEYTLAVSSGATGRLACLDTGGKFRADEMAFDPRDDLLLVANDADGFLSLIKTAGTPSIVDQFFY